MKRKCVSLILSAIMFFSCVTPGFAADAEPYTNRYRYEYVYSSPDYKLRDSHNYTVGDCQTMIVGQGLQAAMLTIMAAIIPGIAEDAAVVAYWADIAAKVELLIAAFEAAGTIGSNSDTVLYTVTVSQRERYKYRVDCLDESRRFLEQTRVYSKIETEYCDGTSKTTYHEYNLK